MNRQAHHPLQQGFTLAEVLIALALLGVIAAFNIPKLMQSNQNERSNTCAKEAAAMLANAYASYKVTHTPTATTGINDLLPYINLTADSTASLDAPPIGPLNGGVSQIACSSIPTFSCYRSPDGATIQFGKDNQFGGTGLNNCIPMNVDPDGKINNVAGVQFCLYFDGAIKSAASYRAGSTSVFSGGTLVFGPYSANPAYDPSWFHW